MEMAIGESRARQRRCGMGFIVVGERERGRWQLQWQLVERLIEWNAIILIVTTAAVTWRMCYVGMEWLFELQHVTASRAVLSDETGQGRGWQRPRTLTHSELARTHIRTHY